MKFSPTRPTLETVTRLHDRDIAVFSDIRSNYTIETVTPGGAIGDGNGDGFITVAHTPVVVGGGGGLRNSDGVDKIRNFEILSFADGNIFLDPTISNTAGNRPAEVSRSPPISGLLAPMWAIHSPSSTLPVLPTRTDVPPISAFTFAWEFEATLGAGDWAPVADPVTGDPIVGPTFTPTPAFELDGLRLRVSRQVHRCGWRSRGCILGAHGCACGPGSGRGYRRRRHTCRHQRRRLHQRAGRR